MNVKPQPRQRTRRRYWEWLLLLALLMSLCCFMLLFAQLALSGEEQEWLMVTLATKLRADYRPDDWVETPRLAPLRIEEVINETTEEVGRDENSSSAPLEPVEPQAEDSPQFMPVYEWPSD